MKKTMICTAAFAFLFSVGMAGVSFAGDTGPAEMTLTTPKAKKPAVFPHKKHQEMMSCDTCHKAADFPKNADTDKWTMKEGHAFCKGCHQKGYEGKKGPTKCNDCHKK